MLMYQKLWDALVEMIENHPDSKHHPSGDVTLEGDCLEYWVMEKRNDKGYAIRLPYGGLITPCAKEGDGHLFISGYIPKNTDQRVEELEDEVLELRQKLERAEEKLSKIREFVGDWE